MRVSEIRVKQIRVNQGLVVQFFLHNELYENILVPLFIMPEIGSGRDFPIILAAC